MRNGFFAAIPVFLLGAVMVNAQGMPPTDGSGPIVSTPVPSGSPAPQSYWSAPISDDVVNAPMPIVDAAPADKGGLGSHAYVNGDYLLWTTSKFPVSTPLVTAGTTAGGGQIGQPGTTLLFGDQRVGMGNANGFRIFAGCWLTEDGFLRGELGGLILSQQGASFGASANGTSGPQVLAQPFFSPNTGTEDALILAAPGKAIGSTTIGMSSQLRGAEANLFHDFVRSESVLASFLVGVRYMNLSDSISIRDTILPQTGVPFGNTFADVGDIIGVADRFETHNNFLGPQIGGRLRYQLGIVTADLTGKIALGGNQAAVGINGQSTLISSVVPSQSLPGGLYALGSNINGGSNTRFSAIPEVGANIGIQLMPGVFVRVGYTLLYWTGVARAGQQINRNLDVTEIPTSQFFGLNGGTGQPVFGSIVHSTYFAQGLNIGMEFRF